MQLTEAQTAVATVLAAILGVVGYELSERDRHRFGRSPWGWPSVVWGVLWFLFFALGLVLFLFARRSEAMRRARFDTAQVPPPTGGRGRGEAEATSGGPGAGLPPAGLPPGGLPPAGLPPDGASPPGATPSPGMPPPGWYPDPGTRFEYRWWDGSMWTPYVSTEGNPLVDTSTDQRIGPYPDTPGGPTGSSA